MFATVGHSNAPLLAALESVGVYLSFYSRSTGNSTGSQEGIPGAILGSSQYCPRDERRRKKVDFCDFLDLC